MVSAERIQVTLSGGAPWGFRLSGGGALPLTINKIRKKSVAHNQGLKEGDAVISINGVHVHDKTQDEALELVEKSGDTLALEIFRGDIDELGRDKPKKTIQVPSASAADEGVITLSATVEELNARAEADTSSGLIMTASVDNVTSDSFDTAESEHGGLKMTATVDEMSGSTFSTADSSSGFTLTASVDSVTSSSNAVMLESSPTISAQVESSPVVLAPVESSPVVLAPVESSPVVLAPVESSPVISAPIGGMSSSDVEVVQSSSTLSATMAEPFVDSNVQSSSPVNARLSPQPPVSPKPKKSVSPQSGYTPQVLPQTVSPQPPQSRSPHPPPAVSPKPVKLVSPQPPPVSPKPPGVSSSVTSTTFDDGQTRREVTREQHVQKSDDGRSHTVVQRETTTTSHIGRPSMLKNQSSAFNAVQPNNVSQTQRSSTTTTTTTLKSTSNIINQKGPAPFSSSASTNIPQQEFQPSPISGSHSSGNLSNTAPPIFKPTKFVPGSGKKDIPGLFTPTSPMVDSSVHSMFKDGKENVAPQPMFQVKNIVSDKAKSKGRDIWRPNVWLPGEQPTGAYEEPSVAVTSKEDFSPYATYPVPKVKPGYSLIEEQKRKLFESQTSRNEYDDFYDNQVHESHGHHKSGRLHVFAPPVEIHADSGYPESPYSPYDEYYYMEEYDDGASSPGSSVIRRKKNLYSDSAFYDTPGKNYPTITEQMKLCKKIAQSLTSAANRRARGAKMFMKRKRKSSKWVHEGHSEWSSSAGDVANLHDLDSELNADEGGNKPLLYFKIPNLKNRINEGKSTKMALTQEQFEKLRLNSKKCEHKAVPPDTCFDIVADLKAHKGRGGRMFERRKQRSDKYIIEESSYVPPQRKLENVLSQPVRQEKSPWEAAMEHGGNVDAAFSHLSEWEKNQRLNQILKFSPPRKLQTTPLPPAVQAAPLPAVRSSLRSDESPHLLKGKDFNRTAKGWSGGGEYPIADHLHHVSPTRQLGPSQSTQSMSQNYNNKIKAWQGPGASPYANQDQWDTGRQDNWQSRQQDNWQSRRQDNEWSERSSRHETQSNSFYQVPRPKSWHQPDTNSYDGYSYRDEIDYTYAPVDYRFGVQDSQTVAYRQPIVPGTDL